MNKTAAIRSQARRAALTKFAAPQSTPEEQAFAAGFCKAAEAMGVDPGALAKFAAGPEDHSTANAVSEVAGHFAPVALGLFGGRGMRLAQLIGGIGNIGGAGAALATGTRSNAAQSAYDSQSHVLQNLIPGKGSYNMWKRIGNKIRGDKAQAAQAPVVAKAAAAMGVDPDTLAKAADLSGYTWGWHDELKDPPPDPVHEIAAKLKDKQDRGIDIEQYRTGTARNIAATAAQLGMGGVTAVTAPALLSQFTDNALREGMVPRGAKEWIRHIRKLAPRFSARHSGVAKALGRLANTGTKGGLAALIAGSAILPAWWGINGIRGALHRADINKAIDRVKGKK